MCLQAPAVKLEHREIKKATNSNIQDLPIWKEFIRRAYGIASASEDPWSIAISKQLKAYQDALDEVRGSGDLILHVGSPEYIVVSGVHVRYSAGTFAAPDKFYSLSNGCKTSAV